MQLTSKAQAARVTRVEDDSSDDQDCDEDDNNGSDSTPRDSAG